MRGWLYGVVVLVCAMVLLGGATRLTDSGLSITQWKPVVGTLPPLSQADWQAAFQDYQKIPEYSLVNAGMTLQAFQHIFWWEWAHRFLGRLIGVAFALPLVVLALRGKLRRELWPRLVGLFALGGLQGLVGWWMVSSGLSDRIDVTQERLAIHLSLACVLLVGIFWTARSTLPPEPASAEPAPAAHPALAWTAGGLVAALLLQIFLGGLVAGLHAGKAFNTWPLMLGHLVPPGILDLQPWWRNLVDNSILVQWQHRSFGLLVLGLAGLHLGLSRPSSPLRRVALGVLLLVLGQVALGVATLLLAAPVIPSLVHQGMAIAVLLGAVYQLAEVRRRAGAAVAMPGEIDFVTGAGTRGATS